MSLPTRERGLKLGLGCIGKYSLDVAPHTGAWIEINLLEQSHLARIVAPHTGAWIEIISSSDIMHSK